MMTRNSPIQGFELAKQGKLDENEIVTVFAAVVDILKESKVYKPDKNNTTTHSTCIYLVN